MHVCNCHHMVVFDMACTLSFRGFMVGIAE
jgi:hypothetical protein